MLTVSVLVVIGTCVAWSVYWPGYELEIRGIVARVAIGPINFSLLQESRPFVGPTSPLSKRIRGALYPRMKRSGVMLTYSRHLYVFLKRLNQKLFTVSYVRKFVDIGVSRWSCVRTRIHDMLDLVHVLLHHNSGIDRRI